MGSEKALIIAGNIAGAKGKQVRDEMDKESGNAVVKGGLSCWKHRRGKRPTGKR